MIWYRQALDIIAPAFDYKYARTLADTMLPFW